MKQAGSILKQAALTLQVVFFLLCAGRLFAQEPSRAQPSVVGGTYDSSQIITFTIPAGTRLSASLNGSPRFEPLTPVILSGNAGEERTYTIETELRSLMPDSPVLSHERFTWLIDLKPPTAPVFSEISVEGGRTVVLGLSESGTIFYQLYHPFTETRASALVKPGSSVFLPDGAVLCAFARDPAGNAVPTASISHKMQETEDQLFRIVNPGPGTWANPQILLVDAPAGTDIFYSLDDSDPALTGLAYGGPVLIDAKGLITLRVSAIDAAGKQGNARVSYSVTTKEKPAELGLPSDNSLAETGEFGEIAIPFGYTWSFGDALPDQEGGRQILFSAVRGTRRYYPLTVSDGNVVWRWICASGTGSSTTRTDSAEQTTEREPTVRIHDWHFVSIEHTSTVYVSLDNKNWIPYKAPVFVDRKSARMLYWYAADWKGGEKQIVRLPAKPHFTGVSQYALSGAPVFLSAEPVDYAFSYKTGSTYFPESPEKGSPLLSSGLLVEVPGGAASAFTVRLSATLDGLNHGDIETRFFIDRKPPRIPSPGIPVELKYSRSPVTFTPTGEEQLVLSIEPKLYSTDGKTFVLTGDSIRPIAYTITLHSVDAAGNASATETRTLTVDLNALYVDSSRSGNEKSNGEPGNGSPDSPFAGLDEALSAVRGTGAWRIYVKGSTVLSRSHTIQAKVSIVGDNALVVPEQNANFVVNGGSLTLTDMAFTQTLPEQNVGILLPESVVQAQPLFDIRNGSFTASRIDVSRKGLSSLSLVRASGSVLSLTGSHFDSTSADYANLFDVMDSTLSMNGCKLQVSARNVSALSVSSTKTSIASSTITVSSVAAARAIEAWNSPVTLKTLILERTKTSVPNRDTAVWLDKKSILVSETAVSAIGFWRYKAVEGK